MYQCCYLRFECLHNQFYVILYVILIILCGCGSSMGGMGDGGWGGGQGQSQGVARGWPPHSKLPFLSLFFLDKKYIY